MDVATPRTPRPAPHATHKFKLLLKREFWEHKGGFLWAPVWAGAISLLLTLMALIVGEVAARKALASGKMQIDGDVTINGLDLGVLTSKMDPDDLRKLADGIDFSMLMSAMWPMVVLGFVVFFYCLGSLYDERKDRSVLFWKSLPLSDRDTVFSKAASALLVAPTWPSAPRSPACSPSCCWSVPSCCCTTATRSACCGAPATRWPTPACCWHRSRSTRCGRCPPSAG
jgi:ABC-2 type transport system permease protein